MMAGRITTLAALLAFVASACGSDTSTEPAGTEPSLVTGTACEVGQPDCEDTLIVGDQPPRSDDEPEPGEDPGASSGFVVEGGLTVEEALATDATGVIAVKGFVVQDASGIRFCDLLAESLPPLCGGASIELANLDTVDPDELTSARGVTWSDQPVTILGEIIAGVLVPDSLSL